MKPEKLLKKLNIVLPEPISPVANYVPVKQLGNMIFVSGQAAFINGKLLYEGKLGDNVTIEEGYKAARIAAMNILSIVKKYLGSLDKVKSVIKVNGYVASTPEFYEHPKVINGASDLFLEIFGDNGKHARIAIGQSSLPFNTPVEVDVIFAI